MLPGQGTEPTHRAFMVRIGNVEEGNQGPRIQNQGVRGHRS
jgi:hypothetical protein